MMERKGLETSRYLGGDPMLSILICDDDTTVLTAIRAKTESVLKELDKKAKYIHSQMLRLSASKSYQAVILLFWISTSMVLAIMVWILRERYVPCGAIQLLFLLQISLSMHQKGMRFKHFDIS